MSRKASGSKEPAIGEEGINEDERTVNGSKRRNLLHPAIYLALFLCMLKGRE
jgi:hypothetical protein